MSEDTIDREVATHHDSASSVPRRASRSRTGSLDRHHNPSRPRSRDRPRSRELATGSDQGIHAHVHRQRHRRRPSSEHVHGHRHHDHSHEHHSHGHDQHGHGHNPRPGHHEIGGGGGAAVHGTHESPSGREKHGDGGGVGNVPVASDLNRPPAVLQLVPLHAPAVHIDSTSLDAHIASLSEPSVDTSVTPTTGANEHDASRSARGPNANGVSDTRTDCTDHSHPPHHGTHFPHTSSAMFEDRERSINNIIDAALSNSVLAVPDALQRIRFAFAKIIRLQERQDRKEGGVSDCSRKCSRCIGVRFDVVSDYPSYTTSTGSLVLWILTVLASLALIVVGSLSFNGIFGFEFGGNCVDCNGATCVGGPDALGDGVCDLIFDCSAFGFDAGDCVGFSTPPPPIGGGGIDGGNDGDDDDDDDDDDGDEFDISVIALTTAGLLVGCLLFVFACCCCCCCRLNWRCGPGVRCMLTTRQSAAMD